MHFWQRKGGVDDNNDKDNKDNNHKNEKDNSNTEKFNGQGGVLRWAAVGGGSPMLLDAFLILTTTFYDITTNLVVGCTPGREGGVLLTMLTVKEKI